MNIQKEKFNELFDLWVDVAHKENVKNFGSLMANALKASLIAMKEVNKNFFDEGVEFTQKVAVPEGFVVVPREPTYEMVLKASSSDDIHEMQLIAEQYKAMIEAQEQVG